MNVVSFKGFLRLNKLLIIPGGLWEPKIRQKYLVLYTAYKLFLFAYAFIWYVLCEYLSILETYNDIFETSNTLYIAATHVGGTIKFVIFFRRKAEILEIVRLLESSDFRCGKSEGFVPDTIVSKYKRWGKMTTTAFYTSGIAYFLLAYLPYVFAYFNALIAKKPFRSTTPYTMWMPFEFDTPVKHALMLLYQGIPHFAFIHVIIGSDGLLTNVMNLVACHLEVLQGAFRTIKERCMEDLSMEYLPNGGQKELRTEDMALLNEKMTEEFKKLVKHLQLVIDCAQKLESFQTLITLGQMSVCTFILCSCLLLLKMTQFGSEGFITYVVYLGMILIQLGAYCTFGNNITIQGQEIPTAIWESDWIDTSVSYKKMMILTMHRMQTPIVLTIGKFAPLTLMTFSSVIKLSYAVFAIFETDNKNC